MYADGVTLTDLYAIVVVNFQWIVYIAVALNWVTLTFYLCSQKYIFSKIRFVPILNEFCVLDCRQHNMLILAELVAFVVSYIFYSVPMLIVWFILRTIVMRIFHRVRFGEYNAWLFVFVPFYRWYIYIIDGLRCYSKYEDSKF